MSDDRIKKLQVKDLTISFRTINGKVQAVRDISFDLYKGETLAIVGESGSGKSVTSKAILGISAANAIVESGEILYDGMDLLKISEDDYHKIRGDKISMIFQDPLSSLNPVMRIGNQITEAMILKNKASRRENRRKLNSTLRTLADVMKTTEISDDDARFATFRKIMAQQAKYEAPYTQARSSAEAALKAVDDMLLAIGKEVLSTPVADANELAAYLKTSVDPFVVRDKEAADSIADGLRKGARAAAASKNKDLSALKDSALKAKALLEEAVAAQKPDFFALAAWIVLGGNTLGNESAEDLAAKTSPCLGGEFMTNFRSDIKGALVSSSRQSVTDMESAIRTLEEAAAVFGSKMPEKAEALRLARSVSDSVEKAIDPFETVKTSFAYTFRVSLKSAIDVYYNDIERNRAEEKRFSRQSARYERLKARGKTPGASVAPLSLSDLDLVQENIVKILGNMKEQFGSGIKAAQAYDFDKRTDAFIGWMKDTAMDSIIVVTKSMAKDRAIRVMEQVGITEARKRYRQYPFEFSGGMRQRIVIAIALTANPDILICDEPTTALDVTIQAQILELINKLKKERDLSVIFITHDLGVVANMADRIAVMYAGKIVEYGTSEDVFYNPVHPYTWALLASIPDLNSKGNKLESIPGTPPNMIYPPKGDAFAARNKYAMEIDFEEQPPMFKVSDTHYAATWLLHPDAPKVEMPEIVRDRIARKGGLI